MVNLYENFMLLVACVAAVWAIGFLFVAMTAFRTGRSAHEENRRLAVGGIASSLRGELKVEDDISEPRSNRGLAIRVKTLELIAQGKLSEEATDEVIGAKA